MGASFILSMSWHALPQEELRLESERVKEELESLRKENDELALRGARERAEAQVARENIEAEVALEASRRECFQLDNAISYTNLCTNPDHSSKGYYSTTVQESISSDYLSTNQGRSFELI